MTRVVVLVALRWMPASSTLDVGSIRARRRLHPRSTSASATPDAGPVIFRPSTYPSRRLYTLPGDSRSFKLWCDSRRPHLATLRVTRSLPYVCLSAGGLSACVQRRCRPRPASLPPTSGVVVAHVWRRCGRCP
ncbi:hypothetical protein BD626DRAFT_499801 [Schizophyllum amplum]|uniref:Secreted protein n=1 Tax=Schizophyllum amplum TaxID=97359 RepID=A0A550CBK9_9AGAR|nr:hypothetical protein BD626DRAFT_499801 [Auriculariopsis ampla]